MKYLIFSIFLISYLQEYILISFFDLVLVFIPM